MRNESNWIVRRDLGARLAAVLLVFGSAAWCVAAPLIVMPLGDSNTVGTANAPFAYRTRLWEDFGMDPTRLKFLGSQQSALGNHEGHSGYTIAAAPVGFGNITDHIGSYLGRRQNPDAVLLMIGTNDMNLNYQVDDAPARLDFLIGRITALKPATKLFVANVPPIDDAHNQFRTGSDTMANQRVIAFNGAIPGIVAAHQARGERVFFVDVYSQLNLSDIEDGLHPTPAGYDKIGDAFYRALVGVPEPGCAALVGIVVGWSLASSRIRAAKARGAVAGRGPLLARFAQQERDH